MKSLSTFIFLGTIIALIAGGIFAVSPALATTATPIAQELPVEPAAQAAADDLAAPLTGAAAPVEAAVVAAPVSDAVAEAAFEPFVTNISKAPSADVQAAPAADQQAKAPASLNLDSFAASLSGGKASQVAGLYVEDVLAYAVTGQNGNLAYVSSNPDVVTKFDLAAQYGSQGFLAHNYLAGASFSQLTVGQTITLVYGDGSTAQFRIDGIRRFQALSPDSTQSRFVDLDNGKELSASGLFTEIYNRNNPVVLQTCIANEGISTWGRLFIIATPLEA